ncbi:m146R [Myxoma virus]|uniref:M146R n=1 Tax=Myxoma virus TaxID=10273 RepID=E2CZN4_9POXV|nr:m146R [Myxoma virus]AGU99827.1 m146R [Myxoma virus]
MYDEDTIKRYIRWRGGDLDVPYEDVFETYTEFDVLAKKKFGKCDYDFIKPMNLTLSDGPRLGKLPTKESMTPEEAIGLCGILAEKVTHSHYDVDWDVVFTELFGAMTG